MYVHMYSMYITYVRTYMHTNMYVCVCVCVWVCRRHSIAVPLLMCCLHACRNQGEGKCRKHIARILWLLMFDDEKVGTSCSTTYNSSQQFVPQNL